MLTFNNSLQILGWSCKLPHHQQNQQLRHHTLLFIMAVLKNCWLKHSESLELHPMPTVKSLLLGEGAAQSIFVTLYHCTQPCFKCLRLTPASYSLSTLSGICSAYVDCAKHSFLIKNISLEVVSRETGEVEGRRDKKRGNILNEFLKITL